jgi:hypothetical protein
MQGKFAHQVKFAQVTKEEHLTQTTAAPAHAKKNHKKPNANQISTHV